MVTHTVSERNQASIINDDKALAWATASNVLDPEIPCVTVGELGIVRDVELIENALNSIITKQSSTIINSASNNNTEPTSEACPVEVNGQISELRDLLGKLHNQKIWYRPKSQLAYIGG